MSTPTHPMILVAATSVTIAGLATAAYFTGLLPNKPGPAVETPPPAAVAAAPVTPPVPETLPAATPDKHDKPTPAPAAKPQAGPADTAHGERRPKEMRRTQERPQEKQVKTGDTGIDVIPATPKPAEAAPRPAEPAVALCQNCGVVDSVQELKTEGEGSGLGAVAGGLLGGLLGHQVGKGSGRDLGTIAGAVGGAFAGHQVEKRVRSGRRVEVTVRMEDGSYRTIDQEVAGRWQRGDHVRIENGRLQPY